jgi:hypothetical protein
MAQAACYSLPLQGSEITPVLQLQHRDVFISQAGAEQRRIV